MLYRHCLIVTLVAAFSCSVQAVIIHVDAANCPGPGDGSVGNPYCSIQTAIDNAVDTDEVVVAPGTYFETINFIGKAVWLHSSDGADVTVIDAQQTGTVVTCDSGEGPGTVFDGFTVTGGGTGMYNRDSSSPTVTNCTFADNTAAGSGGGMYNRDSSSPTVTNCIFTGNCAHLNGGGMNNVGSSPTVTDCMFSGNSGGLNGGGGMYNRDSSPTVTNCTFIGNTGRRGGGMYNSDSSPTVTNCIFTGNCAHVNGGGMNNFSGSTTVIGCTFEGNTAELEGGGMFSSCSVLTVTDCTFLSNTAEGTASNCGGGAIQIVGGTPQVVSSTVTSCTFDGNTANQSGGAILNSYASMTVTDCVFTGNIAFGDEHAGGGAFLIFAGVGSELSVVDCDLSENQGFLGGAVAIAGFQPGIDPIAFINCSFSNNTATVGEVGGQGGALFIQGVVAILSNCTIDANQALHTEDPSVGGGVVAYSDGSAILINSTMIGNAASLGGAIYVEDTLSAFALVNSTLSDNTAEESGGGIWSRGSGTVSNSILWGNSDSSGPDESAQIHIAEGDVAVDFSSVHGLTGDLGGTGNIDADPMFVDPGNGDYRLMPGSPCIDAGHNWGVPPDTADLDEDGDRLELTPWDLDVNPRFVHAAVGTHPGCGIPAVVDMGAYEFQDGKAVDIKLDDIDGDGTVNIIDLLILLASWGPCEPGCCLADLDIDGDVGITDFLLLLGNWG